MLIALKSIRLKTSNGPVEIQQGDTFNPVDTSPFLEAGIAKPVTQETFKMTFGKLSEHLRQRDYAPENFVKLQTLSLEMDEAWQAMDYPFFKKAIDKVMAIPGILKPEESQPQAARIYSKILDDSVWVVTHTSAISFVPEGEIYYLSDEIRNLRGATPEEIMVVHKVKKELGGRLVSVKERDITNA